MPTALDNGRWSTDKLFVAVALLLALSLFGCDDKSPAAKTSVISAGSGPTMTSSENPVSGGPAPAELQGRWLLVSISKKAFKNRFELVIRDRHYGFPLGLVRGSIVAQGNEVDFYNEDLCDRACPEGIGRYRWNVRGDMLHLDLIGEEPCANRAGVLDDATYRRSH
jgi:hypothetical protein